MLSNGLLLKRSVGVQFRVRGATIKQAACTGPCIVRGGATMITTMIAAAEIRREGMVTSSIIYVVGVAVSSVVEASIQVKQNLCF